MIIFYFTISYKETCAEYYQKTAHYARVYGYFKAVL